MFWNAHRTDPQNVRFDVQVDYCNRLLVVMRMARNAPRKPITRDLFTPPVGVYTPGFFNTPEDAYLHWEVSCGCTGYTPPLFYDTPWHKILYKSLPITYLSSRSSPASGWVRRQERWRQQNRTPFSRSPSCRYCRNVSHLQEAGGQSRDIYL